ncbi:MAG: GNAT family N-acetyltransferase [Ruminiclostridium sp.]|nr:GNAT family N-acetyltransferase [Ruminiclostridium sp.]
MVTFKAMTEEELQGLKAFAAPIWRECYKGVVESSHTEMLIEKYFEYENILVFKKDGMIYENVFLNSERIGFIAYLINTNHLYLDKLYFLKEYRGKHLSHRVFEHLSEVGGMPIRLNVNRGNQTAVNAYKANGFKILYEENVPQKDGSVNTDFVMERI